jgi:hypothetical protein
MTSMLTAKDLEPNEQIGPTNNASLIVPPQPGRTGHNALGAKLLVPRRLGLAGKELPPQDGKGLDVRMVNTGNSLRGGSQDEMSDCFLLSGHAFCPPYLLILIAHSHMVSVTFFLEQCCPVCGKSMHPTPPKASQRPCGDRNIPWALSP